MVLLSGRLRVQCPKLKKEVKVNQACHPKGEPSCEFFEHVCLRGMTQFLVRCKFGEKK